MLQNQYVEEAVGPGKYQNYSW